jgi:hypothetical protein
MQLGLIPPNSMRSHMAMTNLHLILPWQTATEDQVSFIRNLPGYKILDNGAAEGMILDPELLAAMNPTDFDEVICPDILMDADFTIRSALKMRQFKEDFPDIQLMGVAQGKDLATFLSCYNALISMPWIDVIGIPRVINHQFGRESRIRFIESFSMDADLSRKQVHCLGAFYGWPEEIRYLKQYPIVRSMDSSLPYVLGMYGMTFDDDAFVGMQRPDDYFNLVPDDRLVEVINDNVARYIKWAS